jgi:hypothetical protein
MQFTAKIAEDVVNTTPRHDDRVPISSSSWTRSPVGGLREEMVRTRKQRRIVPADPPDGASLAVTPRTDCWTK